MNGPYRLTKGNGGPDKQVPPEKVSPNTDVTSTSHRLIPLKTLPSFTRLSRGEDKLEMATSNRSG